MDPTNPLANITLSMLDPSRDCAVAGEFAVHFGRFQLDDDSFPLRTLREFMLACSNTTIDNFTDGNLIDWYRYTNSTTAEGVANLLSGVRNSSVKCKESFCKHLEFEGNADLTGIGVYLTYFLQAALVTLFIAAYMLQDLRVMSRKWRRVSAPVRDSPTSATSRYTRFLDSSLKIVWTSLFLFGGAVNVAAFVYTIITKKGNGLAYTIAVSGSATGLCTTAILSVTLYRSQLSFAECFYLGFAIISAFVSSGTLLNRSEGDPRYTLDDPEGDCFLTVGYLILALFLQLLLCLWLGFLFVCFIIVVPWRGAVYFDPKSKAHVYDLEVAFSKVWRTILAVLSLALMWVFLWCLIQMRAEVGRLVGDSFADNEWEFGQITTVLAWAPLLVEFARAWGLRDKLVVPAISFMTSKPFFWRRTPNTNQKQSAESIELTSDTETENATSEAVTEYHRLPNTRTWHP